MYLFTVGPIWLVFGALIKNISLFDFFYKGGQFYDGKKTKSAGGKSMTIRGFLSYLKRV